MGRYYALAAGEPPEVAAAAEEHYRPLGPSDAVPVAPVSVAVALADKLDTLTGFWAIGETPTGSKDPYALRRAALGVVRIIVSAEVEMPITTVLFNCAMKHYRTKVNQKVALPSVIDRIGYEYDVDEIIASLGPERALLFSSTWAKSGFNKLLQDTLAIGSGRIDLDNFTTAVEAQLQDHIANDKTSLSTDEYRFARLYSEYCTLFDTGAGPILDVGDLRDRTVYSNRLFKPSTLSRGLPEIAAHYGYWNEGLLAFLHDRLKIHLRGEGVRHDVIDACLSAPNSDDLTSLTARARALNAFLATEDGANLVQGYRRAANILAQAEAADGVEYSYGADRALAEGEEERALFDALEAAMPAIRAALEAEDYPAAMLALARLRAPIDAFFEAVQVNADSAVLRRNRLNLLHGIRATCAAIADLSRIEG